MLVVKLLDPIETMSAGGLRQRRIAILQREDGHYSFAEEYAFVSKHDGEIVAQGWQRRPAEGIFETLAAAEREAAAVFLRRYGNGGR